MNYCSVTCTVLRWVSVESLTNIVTLTVPVLTWVVDEDCEPLFRVSPLYWAVTECVPTLRLLVHH